MINVTQQAGIRGQFRILVRRADGSVRLDTGMRDNLVLDNGLCVLHDISAQTNTGGAAPNNISSINSHTFVGTGNTPPADTDIRLSAYTATGVTGTSIYNALPVVEKSGRSYLPVYIETPYSFSGSSVENKNISEVGLGYSINNSSYVLCTRALIQDDSGVPITITPLPGEILELVYRLTFYVDVTRDYGEFELSVVDGGTTTKQAYEYFIQNARISSDQLGRKLTLTKTFSVGLFGGVESDADAASFDLRNGVWKDFSYSDTVSTSWYNGFVTANMKGTPSATNYVLPTELSITKSELKVNYQVGVNTGNFTNGVRALSVTVHKLSGQNPFFITYVVVRNKENGQGIRKTKKHTLSFTYTLNVTRWQD